MNYISWYLKFWVSFVNECWFKPMLVGSSFVKCVRNKKRYDIHVEIKKKIFKNTNNTKDSATTTLARLSRLSLFQ